MAKKAENPVEAGFHTVVPHLICRDAAAAIEFYKRAFGATEIMRIPTPDGKLMHASVRIGDTTVMLVDEMPQWGALSPQSLNNSPVTLHMSVPDVDAVYKRAIDCGAKSRMEVADMFWGDRYGKVEDPFGHHWSIATHIRDMTQEEIVAAAGEAMKAMANRPERNAPKTSHAS
jgi:PhnB protein